MELTDDAIVQDILNGNQYDFSLFLDKYKKSVYIEAKKFLQDLSEIEDVCQEVFLKVFKSLNLFNSEYKLSTWIVAITKNLCIDKVRKKKFYVESLDQLGFDQSVFKIDITPENEIIDKETSELVHQLVNELPEIYQEPIILHYFKGLSYSEVSEKLGVPMSIVKNRIYRAKIILRSKISE